MKRKKANFNDIINQNIEYHASGRVKNVDGVRGTRFILSKAITQAQRNYFMQFKNTLTGTCYNRYNYQLKYDCIILFDKCINIDKI